MLDCGMHMGYNDERRFPDFSYISNSKKFNEVLDCVIISHLCARRPLFVAAAAAGLQRRRGLMCSLASLLPGVCVCVCDSSHLDHCGALPYFTEMCGYACRVVTSFSFTFSFFRCVSSASFPSGLRYMMLSALFFSWSLS